ncbi:hypothetical protein [Paenibacillus lacisoli]|nr:hypothetical protein [Paenibacillus sp. JX-17]
MNDIRVQFNKWSSTQQHIQFFSLHQFYEHLLGQAFTLITRDDFLLWFKENELHSRLTAEDLFLEINTVIKGRTEQKMMTQQQYYTFVSDFSLQEKQNIYFVACLYQKWLDKTFIP